MWRDSMSFWEKTLRDGVVADTAFPPKQVSLKSGIGAEAPATAAQGLEIVFRPDHTIWDGRFANNGWLQELPKPLTMLTWDSVAMLSPKTAERLGAFDRSEDAVELKYQGRTIVAPVWVMPGHADESVTVFLGYGRTRAGRVGTGAGFDAGWIRPLATPWIGTGLEIRRTGDRWALATTQTQSTMEGREPIRIATLDEYQKNPKFAQADADENPLSLYPAVKYEGNQWGMAIDLNACTGCGGCVVACQAENNIAVVGKKEVTIGRHMHWIRIDRYYEGGVDDPGTYHEPVLCMHCENAPCEVVCPVAATVHSSEGLNEMVYNRCVGTRYCSNNCPYKVRRFNFYLYSDWDTPSLFGMRNPNVSVRSRGVMEKCSYCVQRINAVKIEAEKQDRPIRDGEIVTACQQSCPSEAIVFGNINDPNSRVSKLKANNRELQIAGRAEHAAQNDVSREVAQPESGDRKGAGRLERNETWQIAQATNWRNRMANAPILGPGYNYASVTDKISAIVLTRRTPKWWIIGFLVSFALVMLLMVSVTYLLVDGVGIWGIQIPIGWGFAIINFVWWIGIGHAGTLISAILLLLRQQWRTSINRFAEAMTLFAVSCAGIFPLIHMGRPWLAYWLFPYPDTMKMWPQFPQPAGVGRVRGFDLCDGVAAVLVHRPDSGPGDAARPRQKSRRRN